MVDESPDESHLQWCCYFSVKERLPPTKFLSTINIICIHYWQQYIPFNKDRVAISSYAILVYALVKHVSLFGSACHRLEILIIQSDLFLFLIPLDVGHIWCHTWFLMWTFSVYPKSTDINNNISLQSPLSYKAYIHLAIYTRRHIFHLDSTECFQ